MSCPQDGGSGVELLFLDLGGFADFVSEIVELGASDMPSALHFDSVDSGGVKRENLFHADTERDTSDSESLADSAAPSCDDNAGEELDFDSFFKARSGRLLNVSRKASFRLHFSINA